MLTVYTVVVDKTETNKLLQKNVLSVILFMDEILWHGNIGATSPSWARTSQLNRLKNFFFGILCFPGQQQLGSCIACQRKSPVEKKYPESDVKINCREQRAGLEPDMRLGLANKQGRWLVYCDLLLASSTIQHPKYLCKQFFPTGHWY